MRSMGRRRADLKLPDGRDRWRRCTGESKNTFQNTDMKRYEISNYAASDLLART